MLLLTSVGLLLTVALLLLGIRVVILATIGKCSLVESWERNRVWMAPLGIVVLLFWLAPWQGPVGIWDARTLIKRRGAPIVRGLPEEVRNLPSEQRPRLSQWYPVVEAETGFPCVRAGDIIYSVAYENAYNRTLEREVRKRLGEDIFLKLAAKAVEVPMTAGEPVASLHQNGPEYRGWTEGTARNRTGRVMNNTLVISWKGAPPRRLPALYAFIEKWAIVDGEVSIRSRNSDGPVAYNRYSLSTGGLTGAAYRRVGRELPDWAKAIAPDGAP